MGTTNPSSLLTVNGTGNTEILVQSNNTLGTSFSVNNTSAGGHFWQFGSNGSAQGVGSVGDMAMYDNTANKTDFAIQASTGNIMARAGSQIGFQSDANFADQGTFDTGITRQAAGALEVTNGSTGFGNLYAGNIGVNTTSLLGTLDVRANSGTLPTASISGQTSFAGLVIDNKGAGDVFTASSSGLSRFVITQAGNVGYRDNVPKKRRC